MQTIIGIAYRNDIFEIAIIQFPVPHLENEALLISFVAADWTKRMVLLILFSRQHVGHSYILEGFV